MSLAKLGRILSKEVRQNMSIARLVKKAKNGYLNSPETRLKLRLANLGKKHTKETKGKMSEYFKKHPSSGQFKKGVILSEEFRKNMSEGQMGKKHSLETRQKMSKTHKKNKEKNHFWKGGIHPKNLAIRKSFEYKLWREAIFKRDNYTCIWCGDNRGGNLEADHIKSFANYPALRFAIDNGRTLCKPCHQKTDTYGNHKKSQKA